MQISKHYGTLYPVLGFSHLVTVYRVVGEQVEEVLSTVLLPGMMLLPAVTAVCCEAWSVLGAMPYTTRYRLYVQLRVPHQCLKASNFHPSDLAPRPDVSYCIVYRVTCMLFASCSRLCMCMRKQDMSLKDPIRVCIAETTQIRRELARNRVWSKAS
jgi:hypothetical protein